MTLDEVLSLENDKKSIRKIDMFLRDKDETSYEYARAIAYKALILHTQDKDKDALRILLSLTPYFASYDNDSVVALCDTLIEIFLSLDNNDQALKYIDIKNDHLKTIDKDQYIYDMIRYYTNVGNRVELKRTITQYLFEDIDDDKRIKALEELSTLQFYDKEYDNFYDSYKKLKAYYEKSFQFEKLFKLYVREASMLYEQRKLNEAQAFILSYINDKQIDITSKVASATILLNIHLKNSENRRAMILESEYHDIYLDAEKSVALEFAETALLVSKAIQNRFGVEEYEESIASLEEEIKALKKDKKKEKKKSININIIEDEIIPEPLEEETINISLRGPSEAKSHFTEVKSEVKETPIAITERFKALEGVLSALNPNKGLRFRDILRNYGMEIERLYSKCEIVIALNHNGDGFHYKVSRVYEKTFTDDMIKDSPFEELLNNSTKLLLINVKESLWDKNIITSRPFEDSFKAVIGFTLFRNDKPIGAICYNFYTSEFKDIYIFESLKTLTQVLNIFINELYDTFDTSKEMRMYDFITSHSKQGLKVEEDKEITLNDGAALLLGLNQRKLEDSEYIALIDAKDVVGYKEAYRKIYERLTNEATIYYHINGRYIKEDIMANDSSVLEIYSILSDETKIETKERALENKAYNNQISHLKNKSMLYIDLDEAIISKKFAVALIKNDNYDTYFDIYGYKFADDLTLLIGKILKKEINKNMDVYHLENDKFMLVFFDINDMRAIKKRVSDILDEIRAKSFEINPRLKLKMKAGIYRYTKAMGQVDCRKVISYASEALIDAREGEEDIAFYDKDRALQRFRDSQIILYCTEAIDTRELKICYKQMVNADEGTIEYYIPRPNLRQFDCDEEYFNKVVCIRDIKKTYDKYIISETLFELKTFYDRCKVYFPVLIPIHKSVIMDKRFKIFLEQKLKYLKVPGQVVSFNIVDDIEGSIVDLAVYYNTLGINLLSESFDLVIKNKLNAYICNQSLYSLELTKALKTSLDEMNIKMYASSLKSKGEIGLLHTIGIDIVGGDILKSSDTIDTLIKDYTANNN